MLPPGGLAPPLAAGASPSSPSSSCVSCKAPLAAEEEGVGFADVLLLLPRADLDWYLTGDWSP